MGGTELLESSRKRYQAFVEQGLRLNMTRGKPSAEQLDLSNSMLTDANSSHDRGGTDCRNYGVLDGLPDAKRLFAAYLECEPEEIIIGGNASLTMMYDAMMRAMLFGVPDSTTAWSRQGKLKWLCPAPGYDRHFSICERLGIEMIPIAMTDQGPDMEQVSERVTEDEAIKGIWCVPRYANPTGITYSDEVVDQLATLKPAAPDFRIFWDNAYHAHHLTERPKPLKNILNACREQGAANRVLMFGSTSKITFAGAGVSFMAASRENGDDVRKHMKIQTIGTDKLNQLRHVQFLEDMEGVRAHMRKHAAILKPKFEEVDTVLQRELGELEMARWSKPEGGYFISLNTRSGLARRVVAMAAEAGVKLTAAGATYPYGKDPNDSNIRIAPSLPALKEISQAMEVVAVCIKVASLEAGSAETE